MGARMGAAPWGRAWQNLKPSICTPMAASLRHEGRLGTQPCLTRTFTVPLLQTAREPQSLSGWGGGPGYGAQESRVWWGARDARLRSRRSRSPKDTPVTPLHQETGCGPLQGGPWGDRSRGDRAAFPGTRNPCISIWLQGAANVKVHALHYLSFHEGRTRSGSWSR